MSNVSNRHQILPFDSKKSKPLADQRLAVVSYKLTKEDKAAGLTERSKQSVCASIPVISNVTDSELTAFKPYVIQMIQDTQDKIVREFADVEVDSVSDDDISVASVLMYLEEESKGSRLTKEVVKEWYDSTVAEILAVAIADRLGYSDTPTDAQVKQLEQQLNVYREKFASLAGGKTVFPADVASKLQKVLELVSEDAMAQRFNARLEKMKVAEAAVDMMGL